MKGLKFEMAEMGAVDGRFEMRYKAHSPTLLRLVVGGSKGTHPPFVGNFSAYVTENLPTNEMSGALTIVDDDHHFGKQAAKVVLARNC